MVNTVAKALQILDALSDGQPQGVSDLAKNLNLPKSSVFSILETLVSGKIAEKNSETGKYSLGVKLIELGNCAQTGLDICRIAAPFLQGLNVKFDETVHLTVLDNNEVLYIDCIESRRRLRTYSVIGVRAPLHCTSVGKAILAFLPDPEIEKIVAEKGLPVFTPATIANREQLTAEVAVIRKQGFAIDNMEHEEHLRCVGAPIFNSQGKVFASLSLSGPAERNTMERILEMAPEVVAAGLEISRRLGWRGETLASWR